MNPIDASKIVSDEIAIKILVEAARHPTSVLDLSYKLGLSPAACFSRIKLLEEHDLIHCVLMPVAQNGTQAYVYITDYKNMETLFSNFSEELEFIDTAPFNNQEAQA